MAQLVERSLPIADVRGSNPVIGKKINIEQLYIVNFVLKRRKKKKEAGNGSFKKILLKGISSASPNIDECYYQRLRARKDKMVNHPFH